MSCFNVPEYHVRALISWGLDHGVPSPFAPRVQFELLAAANGRAVAERYREPRETMPTWDHVDTSEFSPVQIVKAVDCIEYQCSNWTGWPGSDAETLARDLRAAALRRIPGGDLGTFAGTRTLNGYDAAAWELDAPALATAGGAA